MELKTPLYDRHVDLGGKIVPFAGYLLPVQYPAGVIAEHKAVRAEAGLFDVSHMGEMLISGPDALANLQNWLTNDFANMTDGRVRYGLLCNPSGGVLDDVLVYRMDAQRYWIVVNAANRHRDREWMETHLTGQAELRDISDQTAQLALQGPNAAAILACLADAAALPGKYYTFRENVDVAGVKTLVSRTGYTGEDGFELYMNRDQAGVLWDTLLQAGKPYGLLPCGLGARDTLRLEAAMPLYGHELSETVNPLEAELSFAVKLTKDAFIGKDALVSAQPVIRRRVGIKVLGKGIVRENAEVFCGDVPVGTTTSGTHAPFLGYPIAMALLDASRAAPGTLVDIDVRGRRVSGEIVPLPFYKRTK